MINKNPSISISHVSSEIQFFTIIISLLLHALVFLLPLSVTKNTMTLRQVGVERGAKITQLFLKKKSEQRGEDLNLSTFQNVGQKRASKNNQSNTSLPQIGQISLPEYDSSQGTFQRSSQAQNTLMQKFKGKDISLPQGVRFSSKSQHAFEGSMFDVGIILPQGIREDELNRFEEMFYSFRRRVAEQYINQILRVASATEGRYPQVPFPWTNKTQILRAKMTYDLEGNLQRIDFLQKADAKILQEFFQEVMNDMYKIPNPPSAIINREDSFELIFGLNIIE